MPTELPHNFQGAFDSSSCFKNHSFCSPPSIDCGGEFLRKFGQSLPSKRIVSGGFPPLYVLPASRTSITSSDETKGKPFTRNTAASALSIMGSDRNVRLSVS